jgi:hypothetical protein
MAFTSLRLPSYTQSKIVLRQPEKKKVPAKIAMYILIVMQNNGLNPSNGVDNELLRRKPAEY